MAESLKKTRQTHPGSGCFLGCFGSSGKKKPLPKTIQTSSKKNIPFFSWPMFGCRTKTVPVDNTEKAEADSKSHTPKLIKKKSDSKLFSEPRSPTNHKPSRRQNSRADQPQASSNQAPRERPKETTLQGPEPKIILGDRNLSDTARTGSSLPGSPKVKPKTKSKTQTKLSHAVSLPVVERNQRMANSRIHAGINLKKPQWKNSEVVEKLDPVMGMSIIMVTLVIMLLWGRLCAILCTSAWFYFCPRLRTAITNNDVTAKSAGNSNDLYLNSAEYKKKVVLEGFLERNRRASL